MEIEVALAAVERALESIQYAPDTYPVALSEERRSAARRKRLKGFPYATVYLVFPKKSAFLLLLMTGEDRLLDRSNERSLARAA